MTMALAGDEIHVWCVTLDTPPHTSARFYATLSPDELNRSARLRFKLDRQRFIAARGLLRQLLGQYLDTEPSRIGFAYSVFGKPELSSEFGNRLRFNQSHSAGLALIAVASDSDVGVDLEYVREDLEYGEIARHFFSAAEVNDLNKVPSHLRTQAFFSCWTRKEAYLKACGEGLALPPLQRALSLYDLQPAPGFVGALAIEPKDWRLRQWYWRS